MEKLIWFLVVFALVYLFYLFFVILRKRKLAKFGSGIEIMLLEKRYMVDTSKIGLKKISHIVALANSFIIATTFIIVEFFDNFIIKILVAFVVLMILIFTIYNLIGRILGKKVKNV